MTISLEKISFEIPNQILSLEEIAEKSNMDSNLIYQKLRMKRKPVSKPGQTPYSLALKATQSLFSSCLTVAKQLDFIIYASNGVLDYQMWSPAASIQADIGASKAFAFEVSNGCNSGSLAINLSMQIMGNDNNNYGLIIISDTLSKYLNYSDYKSLPFF